MVHKRLSKRQHETVTVESPHKTPHSDNSTLYNLYLLGRIPFCFEGPLWCLLGNLIYRSQTGSLSPLTTLLSCGLVFLTNVSINYANEYFDYEADSILATISDDQASHGGSKMLVNGTFERQVALYCAAAVQLFILVCILLSRHLEGPSSSLQGLVLYFGLLAMFAAQQYVGPPLRLHYNGGGEVVSSMEIAPGPILYGFLSQVTTASRHGLSLHEAWRSTTHAMRVFLVWSFIFELGRIFMMHAADIEEDVIARKHTLVSMVGHARTRTLYLFTCAVNVLLAWNLVLVQSRAAYLMVPVLIYSAPIAVRVVRALSGLVECEKAGRKAFASIPVLVSLQTLFTPALFNVIVLVVGDCLA